MGSCKSEQTGAFYGPHRGPGEEPRLRGQFCTTAAAPRSRTGRLVRAHFSSRFRSGRDGEAAVGALRGSGPDSDMFSSCLDQQLLSKLTCPAKVNNFLQKPNSSAGAGTILRPGLCLCAAGRQQHRHLYELVWV